MKEEVRRHQKGEQSCSAGIGQLLPIVTLAEVPSTSVTALTELRDALVTGTVPANQSLVSEYLSLRKSTVAIYSQEIAQSFAAFCKGENYHCFHPASGNMKAPNQGPHSLRTSLLSCRELCRSPAVKHPLYTQLHGFTNSQILNNHYRTGIKGLLTF